MAEILSQEEIDALLEVLEGEDNTFEDSSHNEFFLHKEVIPYDFKRPTHILNEQLRVLHSIHENMAKLLASQISSMLYTNIEIQLESLEQMRYSEFLISLSNPTSFNVFSASPLAGSAIIEVNPSIVFAMLESLLGGVGDSFDMNREFSDIELNLFETILNLMTNTLKEAWKPIIEIFPTIDSKESNPTLMQVVAKNETVVVVTVEVIIGHSSGMMHICYPFTTLDPILPHLSRKGLILKEMSSQKSKNRELQVLLGDTQVSVEANLGDTDLSMADILGLQVGDIVRLATPAKDIVSVSIDEKVKFKAKMGLQGFRKSIQIIEDGE